VISINCLCTPSCDIKLAARLTTEGREVDLENQKLIYLSTRCVLVANYKWHSLVSSADVQTDGRC